MLELKLNFLYVLLYMYFKDKNTALPSKLNKVNNTGTQIYARNIYHMEQFFFKFYLQFSHTAWKGKSLKAF